MLGRGVFLLGSDDKMRSTARLGSIDDLVAQPNPFRWKTFQLAPWAHRKLATREGKDYPRQIDSMIFNLKSAYETLRRDHGIRANSFHIERYGGNFLYPFGAYDHRVMKLERHLSYMNGSLAAVKRYKSALENPKGPFARKVLNAMAGLHEEMKELFALYDAAKPSFGLQRDLTDAANHMGAQAKAIAVALKKTEELLTQIEKRHETSEAALVEAQYLHDQTSALVAELSADFDKGADRNTELETNLRQMFNTVLEAKDSFMNQPTQAAASDGNVAEMLKLLTMLAQNDAEENLK